jgi:hypothetical protein
MKMMPPPMSLSARTKNIYGRREIGTCCIKGAILLFGE